MNYKHIFETVLRESKKDLITNNKYLTDEQKEEMLTFFYGDGNTKKPHTNLESKLTWNKPKDIYEEFVSKIKNVYDTDTALSLSIQTSGYNEGEDFLDYGEKNGLHYYVPLNYYVQKEVFQKDCPKRWCIGWEQNAEYWHRYTAEGSIFIIVYSKKDNICVQYNKDKDEIAIWNKQDKSYGFDKTEFLEGVETHSLSLKDVQENSIANNPNDNEALAISDEKEFVNKFNVDILEKWINNFDEIHDEIVRQDDYEDESYISADIVYYYLIRNVKNRLNDVYLDNTNIYVGLPERDDSTDDFNFVYSSCNKEDDSETFESQKNALLGEIDRSNILFNNMTVNKEEVESALEEGDYFELFITTSLEDYDTRITFTPHLIIYSDNMRLYDESGDSIFTLEGDDDEYQMDWDINRIVNLISEDLDLD